MSAPAMVIVVLLKRAQLFWREPLRLRRVLDRQLPLYTRLVQQRARSNLGHRRRGYGHGVGGLVHFFHLARIPLIGLRFGRIRELALETHGVIRPRHCDCRAGIRFWRQQQAFRRIRTIAEIALDEAARRQRVTRLQTQLGHLQQRRQNSDCARVVGGNSAPPPIGQAFQQAQPGVQVRQFGRVGYEDWR